MNKQFRWIDSKKLVSDHPENRTLLMMAGFAGHSDRDLTHVQVCGVSVLHYDTLVWWKI